LSQFYNILSFTQGDEFQTNYGPLVTYWLEIEGIEGTIRTNKKPGNVPTLGQNYGELEVKTNQKGGQYYNFKGMKNPEGVTTPSSAPVAQPAGNVSNAMPSWFVPVAKQIDFIYREMKNVEEKPADWQGSDVEETETVEPIAPNVKKMLDDTFGTSENVEEDLSQEDTGSARK